MIDLQRIWRHGLSSQAQVRRAFPAASLARIENEIGRSETLHSGQIRFVVEAGLDGAPLFKGQSAGERAIDVFSQLRIWDTESNNGLLIYLLLADRAVEIVADRGIHGKVGNEEWRRICREMEASLKQSDHPSAVIAGIQAVTVHLARHFPGNGRSANELPDQALIL
jgi:uncharacterized membrane protein